jgi:hypothetical protein
VLKAVSFQRQLPNNRAAWRVQWGTESGSLLPGINGVA